MTCAQPGIYPMQAGTIVTTATVRPGGSLTVEVLDGHYECRDTVVMGPSGSPTPTPSPEPSVTVTLYLAGAAGRVTLGTYTQSSYGEQVTLRVPASTVAGTYSLATSTGVPSRGSVQVVGTTLPRTGAVDVPLAAAGVYLVVLGAFALSLAVRLRRTAGNRRHA